MLKNLQVGLAAFNLGLQPLSRYWPYGNITQKICVYIQTFNTPAEDYKINLNR